MKFNLQNNIYRLLSSEPYYAELCLNLDKEASTLVKTAGVGITREGTFKLLYNEEWVSKHIDDEIHGLLIHELDHIDYGHVTKRGPIAGKFLTDQLTKEESELHKRWNTACDLAVNGNIPLKFLPKDGKIPGYGNFAQWPRGHSAEQYFNTLEDKPGFGDGSYDDHSMWGKVLDSDGLSPEEIENIVDNAHKQFDLAIKNAVENCQKNNQWGSLSEDRIETLKKRYSNTIDWTSILKWFLKTTIKAHKRSTYMRLNRRYPNVFPGHKYKKMANVVVAIDASGSISKELFEKFWAELENLANDITFTVIQFDTKVNFNEIVVWKKGDKLPPRRVNWGGTDFKPVIEFADELNPDGLIICTDMGSSFPGYGKTQRLWVTTKDYYDSCWWPEKSKEKFAIMEM